MSRMREILVAQILESSNAVSDMTGHETLLEYDGNGNPTVLRSRGFSA